jgi:homoserine O-acetyltransferase/O-succinyltransferase
MTQAPPSPQPADNDSVGIVVPQTLHFDQPLQLACGRALPEHDIVYETYGELNADKSNGILICHALSGHHHAAGKHSEDDRKTGWWDSCIGPGKPIDTNVFFVLSINNIGGCHGSTGPTSINPETGKPWGPDFPPLRCRDWVESQYLMMQHFGISQWAAIIGGSLGGMQAMRWALEHPDALRHCIVIASAMKLSAQNIAFNEIARRAITSDANFYEGRYLEHNTLPRQGLALARMVGHITYLSEDGMKQKFGRELKTGNLSLGAGSDTAVEFEVESYLRYQGEAFSSSFDANTYLLMTKALDYYDLAREYNDDPVEAFKLAKCSFMVASFTTDWRFAPARSREIVDALVAADKAVSYAEIEADHGHDAFLIPIPRYMDVFHAYMKRLKQELGHAF